MDRTYRFYSRQAVPPVAPTAAGCKSVRHSFLPENTLSRALRYAAGVALCGLAACSSGGGTAHGPVAGPAKAGNVAVLLPLSGPNASLGQEMLSATKLALSHPVPGASGPAAIPPGVDAHDTAGPAGAVGALGEAVKAGDGIVLGPLTSMNTAEIAPVAQQAGLPVIAFTSDVQQKRPGVWVFGITPGQQAERLVSAAAAEGRKSFAAFLPDTPLGHALGEGLVRACETRQLATPQIVYHQASDDAITTGLARLADYEGRVAAAKNGSADPSAAHASPDDLPADLAAALDGAKDKAASGDASPAASAPAAQPGPPPFDALLLGDTGLALKTVMNALQASQVSYPQVRILGPGLWGAFAGKLGHIAGAWYAAPDPANRREFVRAFAVQTHHVPKPLADLAYDAGALANAVYAGSGGTGYPADLLTRDKGYSGVDGLFTLLPDGSTIRDLAIFEVQKAGEPRIVNPGRS